MNTITSIHPDAVYEALAATAAHPSKRRNLRLIHEVCRERKKLEAKDFSLKAVGEAVAARGGITLKALWNAQSADYRRLIEAWEAYAGGPKLREVSKPGLADALTGSISDPAARIIVQKLVRERNELRVERDLLKAQTKLVIDRRPAVAPPLPPADGTVTIELSGGPTFNALEREALEHAVSPVLWQAEGWMEEQNGRVVKDLGEGRTRTIFKPGFVSAIRKVLERR